MPATGTLFDLTGKIRPHHRLDQGHRQGHRRTVRRPRRHGAISSRKPGPCEEVAAAINAKHGDGTAIACPANISSKDDLKRLVDETNAAFGKIDILVCNAASNPYYGPMSGITDEAFAKILSNNIISNNTLIHAGRPADGAAEGRRDHHHLLDRRPARLDRHRRLLHLESRRRAARPQPRRRTRAAAASA